MKPVALEIAAPQLRGDIPQLIDLAVLAVKRLFNLAIKYRTQGLRNRAGDISAIKNKIR